MTDPEAILAICTSFQTYANQYPHVPPERLIHTIRHVLTHPT